MWQINQYIISRSLIRKWTNKNSAKEQSSHIIGCDMQTFWYESTIFYLPIIKSQLQIVDFLQGGRGHWNVFLHWFLKFYNNAFFFVGLTTLVTFIKFWLVGSLRLVFKHFNNKLNSTDGGILWLYINLSAIVLSP